MRAFNPDIDDEELFNRIKTGLEPYKLKLMEVGILEKDAEEHIENIIEEELQDSIEEEPEVIENDEESE